jgi:pilus assembly protein Flp/PilA
MRQAMIKFLCAEDGATAIEYGLIGALVILVIISALSLLGNNLAGIPYAKISAAL